MCNGKDSLFLGASVISRHTATLYSSGSQEAMNHALEVLNVSK